VFAGRQGKVKSTEAEIFNLWRIPIGGGAPVKITGGGQNFRYPSFTSDGEYIVYISSGQIWRIRKDGAGGRMRIPGSGIGRDFAPNVSSEDRIVFCSIHEVSPGVMRSVIWTCNMNGGELTQLREGFYPMWSPDGTKIVFTFRGDIWMINSDGTELTQLTSSKNINEVLPSFSDDGEKIVFASNRKADASQRVTSGDFNIWVMNSDGSEATQLTELKSWDSWPLWIEGSIFFLSGRAAPNYNLRNQRVWRLELRD
jgi:Tol biopolymer transport system component